jgi:hypothetical protein
MKSNDGDYTMMLTQDGKEAAHRASLQASGLVKLVLIELAASGGANVNDLSQKLNCATEEAEGALRGAKRLLYI